MSEPKKGVLCPKELYGPRLGNCHTSWAPHGCYPCRGNDEWVAIAVTSDEEWRALYKAMGKTELAAEESFWENRRQR